MKLPKTFVPDKELENKIKQLLEGVDDNPILDDESLIDAEAGNIFPSFIQYLKEEYGGVIIEKKDNTSKKEWLIYIPRKDGEKIHIGEIQEYKEEIGPTLEVGYEADVITQASYKNLKCRIGYHGYDSLGSPVSSEDVHRYDFYKHIPFP